MNKGFFCGAGLLFFNKSKKYFSPSEKFEKPRKTEYNDFSKKEADFMTESKKFTVKDLAEIGVLAALVFVATYFIKFGPIPTLAGPTMLKTGNAVCLLGAMLFGKTKGGLAAGIGSMIYDLTDPAFVAGAPFTFAFFFAMAWVCGLVSGLGGNDGTKTKQNLIGAISGAVTYLFLHLGKSFIALVLEGSDASAALAACSTKLITSGINAVFAVVISVLLAPVCKKALNRAYKGR